MTLIFGMLTQRYVLLASDRRVVVPTGGGSYCLDDDDRTKLAVLGTSSVFGYTGLAEIGGMRTHSWFIKFMKPSVDQGRTFDGLRELRHELTRQFKRPRIRRLSGNVRRHAFLGVGFKRRNADGHVFAAADLVTNFHDSHGNEYETAQDQFIVRSLSLKPHAPLSLLGVGAVPREPQRHRDLERYLRRRLFLGDPLRAAHLLAHEIRRVAVAGGQHGPVGEGLLICCIPLNYVLNGGVPGGPLDMETMSFAYVPASGTEQVWMTPALAVAGFPALFQMIGFRAPPPADGSDPYAEWRHELALPTDVFGRHLP